MSKGGEAARSDSEVGRGYERLTRLTARVIQRVDHAA
jgi:hypothetical protein